MRPTLAIRLVLYITLTIVLGLIALKGIDFSALTRDEEALGPLSAIDTSQLRRGGEAYRLNCARCHGEEGKAGTGEVDLLASGTSHERFHEIVRAGAPKMPSYDGVLDSQTVEDIFWYLEVAKAGRKT